LRHLYIAPVF